MAEYLKLGGAYACVDGGHLQQLIKDYKDLTTYPNTSDEDIKNIYIVPNKFYSKTTQAEIEQYNGDLQPKSYTFNIIKLSTLNGYTPRNKKLLTYPYCYMMLSNNAGVSNILRYEQFKNTDCTFTIKGIPTPRLFNKMYTYKLWNIRFI